MHFLPMGCASCSCLVTNRKATASGGSIFKILWLFGFCGTGTLAGEVLRSEVYLEDVVLRGMMWTAGTPACLICRGWFGRKLKAKS
jgi:hypothetical protein